MRSARKPEDLLFSVTKKDFRFETFRSGGKGGQHQNVRDSGVRIVHIETGLSAECREERDQFSNKKKAFEKLVKSPEFQTWLKKQAFSVKSEEELRIEAEKELELDVKTGKVLVEERIDGKWVAKEE